MAEKKADWVVIRGALVLFILCVLMGAAMITGSYLVRERMQLALQNEERRFKNISTRYLAVDQEEKLIRSHYPRFVAYYRDGLIGSEQRLNWLESLRQAGEQVRILDLRYQIDSQEVWQPDFSLQTGVFELYRSRMNLNMALLHEGDLFALFEALASSANGQFSVTECSLRRSRPEITATALERNLTAECSLDWYTLDLSGERRLEL